MKIKTLREGLTNRKRRPFVCHPLLPAEGLLTIHGAPASLKSMLTKNAVMEAGQGLPIWGQWKVRKALRTLYIDMEHGEDMFLDSLEKIQRKRNYFDAPDLVHYRSRDFELRLDSNTGMFRLAAMLKAVQPDLLVLDPWSEMHGIPDVDNSKQLALLRQVRTMRPGMCLWIVHHDCKTGEFRHSGTAEAMRGSALYQASESIVSVQRSLTPTQDSVRLNFSKLRYGKIPVPVDLLYDENTDTFEFMNGKLRRLK